jgi:hypothetical protein
MIPAIPISSSDPRCLHVGDGTQVGDVQTVRRTVPPDMFNPRESHALVNMVYILSKDRVSSFASLVVIIFLWNSRRRR